MSRSRKVRYQAVGFRLQSLLVLAEQGCGRSGRETHNVRLVDVVRLLHQSLDRVRLKASHQTHIPVRVMQQRVDEVVQTVVGPDHRSVLNSAQRKSRDGIQNRALLVEPQWVQVPEGEVLDPGEA